MYGKGRLQLTACQKIRSHRRRRRDDPRSDLSLIQKGHSSPSTLYSSLPTSPCASALSSNTQSAAASTTSMPSMHVHRTALTLSPTASYTSATPVRDTQSDPAPTHWSGWVQNHSARCFNSNAYRKIHGRPRPTNSVLHISFSAHQGGLQFHCRPFNSRLTTIVKSSFAVGSPTTMAVAMHPSIASCWRPHIARHRWRSDFGFAPASAPHSQGAEPWHHPQSSGLAKGPIIQAATNVCNDDHVFTTSWIADSIAELGKKHVSDEACRLFLLLFSISMTWRYCFASRAALAAALYFSCLFSVLDTSSSEISYQSLHGATRRTQQATAHLHL